MREEDDLEPGLRVIGDEASAVEDEVVRLERGRVERVTRLGAGLQRPAPEQAVRLAADERKMFEARSQGPVVEEILELPPVEEAEPPLEERWGAARRRGPVLWGWLSLVMLVCGAAAVWWVRQLSGGAELAQGIRQEAGELAAGERRKEEQARQLVARIEARLAGYLAAPSVAEAAGHVRQRERVEPLMRDWHARHPYRAAPLRRVLLLQPVTLDHSAFWVAQVEAGEGTRALLLEQDGRDEVWVDWETDVCYQPMEWDEFVAKRPEGLYDFRVSATLDNYYAHEFSDSGTYQCLRLTAKGGQEHLFAYVRRGGEDERRLMHTMADAGPSPASLVLKLGFLPGSKARRGASVVSVVATRWCIVGE